MDEDEFKDFAIPDDPDGELKDDEVEDPLKMDGFHEVEPETDF